VDPIDFLFCNSAHR